MKGHGYHATIIVIFVVLLGLRHCKSIWTKDGYPGSGNALGDSDIRDTGIGGLVVAKAVDILPAKVSQGLVRLIGGLVALFPNSIPSKALGGFLWRHFVVITPVIVRIYVNSVLTGRETQSAALLWNIIKITVVSEDDIHLRFKSLQPLAHLPDLPPARDINLSPITVVHTISPFWDYSMRSGVLGHEPIDPATA